MDLRTKLLLGLGLALVLAFTLVAAFSVISMQASYLALESHDIRHAGTVTRNTMDADLKNIYSTARDYAAWTDTYRFVAGENPGWADRNMVGDFFARFGLEYVVIFNRSGDPVFATRYNTSTRRFEPLPGTLVAEVRTLGLTPELITSVHGTSGVAGSSAGPLLLASHPVLNDDYTGPADGTISLAREIDQQYLADLSERTGYTVRIVPASEVPAAPPVAGISDPPAEDAFPVATGSTTVAAYVPLGQGSDRPAYFLETSKPRTIYTTGMAGIATFLVSLAGAGIFIILFVLLFVDRVILYRVNNIIRNVREQDAAGALPPPADPGAGDELTRLALTIDPVFARLAESRAELARSEERYRTLAESAQDIIFIIDRNDTVLYVNSFAADSLRMKREDIVGRPRTSFFRGEEAQRQEKNLRTVLATGRPVKIEGTIPLPTGDSWQDTLLVPIRDGTGAITGVMGISRDITQRKRAEEALKISNERFRAVMDSLDALVYVADLQDHTILFMNRAGRTVVGDVIGRACWKTLQPDQTGPCSFCTNDRLVDADGKPAGTVVWEHYNRMSGRWYQCRDSAIRWTDGRLVRLEIATDITDRKRAEEALVVTNKKLSLLSGITRHDILNQLTALASYLDLSLAHVHDDVLRDFIGKEQAIALIIDREINFTRDYEDLGATAPVWHPVSAVVSAAAESLSPGRVKITSDLKGLEVYADPMLEKVFFNLLDNAIRYGGERLTQVAITYRQDGDLLVITCEDDGAGVPDTDKEKIFERGFGKHTGLGLFLSREILGITGITIRETGTRDTGARFEILVPKGMWRFAGDR